MNNPDQIKSASRVALLRAGLALCLTGAILGAAGLARAASQTWNNGSTDFLWNGSSLNWGGAAWTVGNDAVFGATGVGTITVSGTQTVGTGNDTPLTFNTAGYTIAGGTLTLPGGNPGYTNTIAVNADATIASLISASGVTNSVIKTGTANLTLNPGSGNTNFMGSLAVQAGTVTLSSGTLNVTTAGTATTSSTGPGLIISGGKLTIAGGTNNTSTGMSIQNGGTLTLSSGTFNNGSEIFNAYGGMGTIKLNGGLLSANYLRPSQYGGNGGLGGVVNLNGGTLQLALFSGGGSGTVYFNGATVQARSSQANFVLAGITLVVQTGGAIIDTVSYNIGITNPLIHASALGAIADGGLTKLGTGTLALYGTNTYTGPTTINGGTLSLSQPTLSAISAITLGTNTILNLSFVGTNTVLALTLGGVLMPAGTYGSNNYPAYITGPGSLVNLGGTSTANLLWTGATNNNWDTTTTNWSSLGAATTWINAPAPANASFGAAGAGTVNLTQAISANSLTFNAAGYTIAGNTLTLGTNAPNVFVNTNAAISSVLTNSTGLTLTGTGTLTLSGANTFAGNVAVNSGNLVVNNQKALGFASATVANGSQISIGLAATYTNALTLSGATGNVSSTGPWALKFNGGTVGWSGPITLAGGAIIGGYAGSGSYTLSGGIGGTGDLQIWAGGASSSHVHNFTLSAPCNYTGNTLLNTFAACPVVILSGGANRLPTNTVVNMLAGIWGGQVLSATLQLNGNNQALAGLVSGSGVFGSGGSNSVVNGSATAANLTLNGALNGIFDGYLGGPGANQNNFSLTKNGAAQLTINRACTCSGTIAVNGGMLNLSGGIINGGPVTVANGATLLLGNGTSRVAGLTLGASSTLGVSLGATNNPANTVLQVSGNLVLAGTLLVQDLGDAAVSNSLTVITYTGNLTNLGMTTDPRSQWNVSVDASTPGRVKLLLLSKVPTISFTTSNLTVSNSLQLQMNGTLTGFPLNTPVYYEVHTPDNRLWDFGAMPPTANWTIYLRHLRSGTNNVRVFTLGTGGTLQQDTRQVVLQLASNPPVRPRPYPAEIWWGGEAGGLMPDRGYSQLVNPALPWNFVQKYQDGIYLHGLLPTSGTLQQLAATVSPTLGRFGLESQYYTAADPNFGVKNAATINTTQIQLQGAGINLTFHSCDYNPCMATGRVDPGWCENWPNWTHDQLLNTNMNCWNDFVTILHTNWPGLKLGMTCSPVGFNWNGYPCTLGTDGLILHPVTDLAGNAVTNQYGTNAWFSFDWQEFFLKAGATAQAGDGYYGFASDCPYDYFAQWSNAGAQTTNQQKILAYEAWERTNGYFPTTICNYSQANSPDTNVWDQQYMTNSFAYIILKQQLGGRTQKYLFESWYSGPYTWAPESNTNSFSGMVKLAIKYLKGITDTNGNLEPLNLGILATGTTNIISLTNNGDVACLPAITVSESGSGYLVARYFNNAGQEITAQITGAEGYCHTNLLQPGQSTTLSVVVAALAGAVAGNTRTFTFEAFWNPQDPTGVVRDRKTISVSASSVVAPPSPLAWYKLDGNANDSSGNGFNGTPSGVSYVTGLVGTQAAAFNGTSSYIQIPRSISNDFSLTFWVKTTQTGGTPGWASGNGLVDGTVAGQTNDFGVSLVGANAGFGVGNPDTTITSTTAINDGQWHHVAATRTSGGGAMNLYVDGVWQAGASGPTGTRNTPPVLRLGGLQTGGNFFSGTLDDVRLYGSSLNGSQVAALATLTPSNTAPSLSPITNYTLIAGQTLTITNMASDPDAPPQTLTFSLPAPPSGAGINATNGIFSWRPAIAQSPSSNAISVMVADNGTPVLSATQSFNVTVLRPATPAFGAPAFSNGVMACQINGDAGPDYTVQAATNLVSPVNWQSLLTTNGTPPFQFQDSSTTNFPQRFYRVLLGP